MCVIELNELSKWYGEVMGLNDVTASIGHGITGLVGPNGAGKSTMMGLATGQLRPSKGEIRVLGKAPWDAPATLSQIGYCPEGDRFWSYQTGLEFVTFLAKASGLGRNAKTAAIAAIEQVGMGEHMKRRVGGYSKGMRQRIKIAQALVHKPRLLILDEPFTGTDPVVRHELAQLFKNLHSGGVDILISSHVLHEVEGLTSQILMINHGRVVAQGDLHVLRREMHNRPLTLRVRVDRPRVLAASLSAFDSVTGLQWVGEEILIVETSSPQAVCDRMTDLALSGEISLREFAPVDESLEAVFGYLTDRATNGRGDS